MSLFEVHFHDSEFVFRPSMRIGPSSSESSDGGGQRTQAESEKRGDEDAADDLRFPLDEGQANKKRGVVLAVLLIGVLLILRKALQDRENT